MKTLQVTGKIIETLPIVNLIQQGESGTQDVAIQLPKNIDHTDLSSLFFVLYGVGEGDVCATSLLKKEATEDFVNVIWRVTSDFTCNNFPLSLKLVGMNQACHEVIKFSGRYPILAYSDSSVVSPPSSMGAFQSALMEMQQKLDQAGVVSSLPPYIGENGNWFLWDSKSGSYEDSGRPAKGEDGEEPSISVKHNEDGQYVLSITTKSGTIDTPNLIGGLRLNETNALYANLLKGEASGEPPVISDALPLPLDELTLKGKTTEALPSVPKNPLHQSKFSGIENPKLTLYGKNCFSPGSQLPITHKGISVEFLKETGEFLLNGTPQLTGEGVSIALGSLPFLWQCGQSYSLSVAMSGGSYSGSKDATSYIGAIVREGAAQSVLLETGFNLTQAVKSSNMTISYPYSSPSTQAALSLWIGSTVTGINNVRVKIQLAAGQPGSFVPFQGSQFFSVLLDPLYGLPGAQDQADLIKGVVTRHVELLVFNGSENWATYDDKPGFNLNHQSFKVPLVGAVGAPSYKKSNMGCSAYTLYDGDTLWATDTAGIWLPSEWPLLVVKAEKSLIPGWSDTVSAIEKARLFKAFLSEYPVTILYQKQLPTQEAIPALNLQSYQGETFLASCPPAPALVRYSQDTNIVIRNIQKSLG